MKGEQVIKDGELVSGRESDCGSVSVYLREINRIPLLSREEEGEIGHQIALGAKWAKEKLIRSNLRFVVSVAKKYQNHGLSLADLISEGNLGLMIAADKFDVEKGYHFISYAIWWIKQSILKAVCEKSRMIRLPLNRANELMQIEKVKKELSVEKEKEVTIEEIADFLHMDKDKISDLSRASREFLSLDSPLSTKKDANPILSAIEDRQGKSPETLLIHRSLQVLIESVLLTLTDKEANVIRYRFGLGGRRAHSLDEIGEKYNLTKERIRQIEKKALVRLRHPTRKRKLQNYVIE